MILCVEMRFRATSIFPEFPLSPATAPDCSVSRKCGKLNEDLPPAGQSPSGALTRNTHQILVHTLWTNLHRCMRRGVVTKKVCPGLESGEEQEASRNGTLIIKIIP